MDIKTWLVEMVVAACVLAGAIIALTLMVGHTLLTRLTRKSATRTLSRQVGG